MKRLAHVCAWMVGCMLLAGMSACSTVKFYSQAIEGQAEILQKARPMAEVMRDERVAWETKRRLAVVQNLRAFAQSHLHLPADRQYDRYADLGRRYVSWVVYAAPEFSVEGKTWCYPFVGPLEYRGFFSKQAADDEAARLKSRGYDVHVGGVEAYSTLGWFRDPVLNTFFRRTDPELAELLFHELTHVKLFAPGDTDFNEAFATANAEEGVRRWLKAKGDRRGVARYEAGMEKGRAIIRLLLTTRKELERLYSNRNLNVAEMRREKAAVFTRMGAEYSRIRTRWSGDSRMDYAFAEPWNNARLNTVATYHELVPGFERLLRNEGGDLLSFYTAVEKMRRMSPKERRAALAGD
jgi:predicted aminopeptidase